MKKVQIVTPSAYLRGGVSGLRDFE